MSDNQNKPAKKHNILEIKDYLDFKYEFRRNELTLELEIRPIKENKFTLLDEAFINSIWIDLQIDGFRCSDGMLLKILNSKLTKEFNPLLNYFDSLPHYDGEDHIAELAKTIKVADMGVGNLNQQELWLPYLRKWLVASVATAIGKGTNHLSLILVGGQGVGKTSWLNRLCPTNMKEFLICSHINPSLTDNNTCNFLAEKWFINIDDQLETIFGKDFNSMKAIITAPAVTNRKTWHRFSRKRKRIASFMGSVNSPKFLTDHQNRRYLVFTTEAIDFQFSVDMDKVWAQALHLVNEGYTYWFSQEEISDLNKINEIYRQVPPEEEWLMKLYEPCEPQDPKAIFMMPSEILSQLNIWSGLRLSIKRLSQAMENLGYAKKVSKRINGQPRNVYPVKQRSDGDEQRLQNEIRDNL